MLEMALDTVRMARDEYEVEEECTDGLLLWEIVKHPRDGFIGRIAFSYSSGRVSTGVDDSPCR